MRMKVVYVVVLAASIGFLVSWNYTQGEIPLTTTSWFPTRTIQDTGEVLRRVYDAHGESLEAGYAKTVSNQARSAKYSSKLQTKFAWTAEHSTTISLRSPSYTRKPSTSQINFTTYRKQKYYSSKDLYTAADDLLNLQLPNDLKPFSPAMNSAKMHLLRQVFFSATKLLQNLRVQYILTQGSLVGSYLHHNMIPWDDDLDVLVDQKHEQRLRAAFANGTVVVDGAKLKIHFAGRKIWKIYLDMERNISDKHLSNPFWPFLDMFPYIDKGNHLVQNVVPFHSFPKMKIYPIQKRPFEGSLQPVPCDAEFILRRVLFNTKFDETCKSRQYSHLLRKLSDRKAVPCKRLQQYYPFVKRSKTSMDGDVTETLSINTTVVGMYQFPKPVCGFRGTRKHHM